MLLTCSSTERSLTQAPSLGKPSLSSTGLRGREIQEMTRKLALLESQIGPPFITTNTLVTAVD